MPLVLYIYVYIVSTSPRPESHATLRSLIGHLQSSSNLGRKVVVLAHRKIKDGVAHAVVDGKRRLGILGRVDRVAAKGVAKRDVLGHVHLGVPHILVAPLGAALAGGGDLEVRGVDERRLLENLVGCGLVEWGGVVAALPVSVNVNSVAWK